MRTKATLLTAVALLAGGCAGGGSLGDAPRVVPLEGDVFLMEGQDRAVVDDARDVDPGGVVATGSDGWARVLLGEGRVLELAPRSAVRVKGPSAAELVTGRTLIAAPSGIDITSGEARVHGSGDFRLDRFVGALRLAVYEGSATVEGWDGRVSSLEQVGVAAGIVPQAPVPLAVDPSDVWDSRKLGPAIDLGRELDDLQRGLRLQLEPDTPPGTLARILPPAFPAQASESRLRRAEPAEALVAAMVALQAAREAGIPTIHALQQVMRLRGLGASWIVVVARWELYSRTILGAMARLTGLVASVLIPVVASGDTDSSPPAGGGGASPSGGASGSPSASTSTDTGGSGGGGGGQSTGGGTGGGDGGGGGGGSTGGGGTGADRPTCGSAVECAVQDVIDDTGVGGDLGLNP